MLRFFLPWVCFLCFSGFSDGRGDSFFTLPNNFELVRFYDVDEFSGIDDSDEPIVQVSVSALSRRYSVVSRSFAWYDVSRRCSVPAHVFYPLASERRFPIIVFSHGLGGSPSRCSYLGSAWAARGFIVVLLQHPGSDENVWQGKVRVLNELREAYKICWNGRGRALDIRFALDQLEMIAASGDRLGSLLDLENIGVGGYDLGALASLLVAGQLPPDGGSSLADPRIKALLAMSPPIHPPRGNYRNVYAAINVPAFFITGTDDDGIIGSTKASERRIPFDSMSENNRFLVILQGAGHMVYGGHFRSARRRNDQVFQQAISRSSTLFWRAYLQNDELAIMDVAGYRLNAILGGTAMVERRLDSPIPAQPEILEAPRETQTTSAFPPTRFYRAVVRRIEN